MLLFDIRNLIIEFKIGDEWVKVVDWVSMILIEGEICGFVGEFGFGKSLIVKVICGVNKDNWCVIVDCMCFDDIDLLCFFVCEWCKLVGYNVLMIFQELQLCFDFLECVGCQLM